MSGFRSISSSILKVRPIDRKELSRYSWIFDIMTIQGSILPRIIGPVLTVTLFSLAVATANEIYGKDLELNNGVIPLLSVVVGLILVFRNGTSYDRYYEGRKDFGALTSSVRNLSRVIWVQVFLPSTSPALSGSGHGDIISEDPKPGTTATEALTIAKVRVLRLLLSFVYAARHHLRNEPGVEWADYKGILPHDLKDAYCLDSSVQLDHETFLDRYATYSAINGSVSTHLASSKSADPIQRRPFFSRWNSIGAAPETIGQKGTGVDEPDQRTPLLRDAPTIVNVKAVSSDSFLPLPLVIAHELSMTLLDFKLKNYIEVGGPVGFNAINMTITGMVDMLTSLERVATTPIPISYGIHLKQCVTLYLFALPFTLVQSMHWKMVPLVTLVAFTLMGIEGIADEIEMPFGNDNSDLPLDRYCSSLRSEIEYMIERLPEGGTRALASS
ncbi:hypothetical protein FRB98_003592 [Tulasnella sp. 332]|nr:hypothetical protein FRB98_003592 [Tulasnella sp. 332]